MPAPRSEWGPPLAARLDADRGRIVAAFESRLLRSGNPLLETAPARAQLRASAVQVIDDLRAGLVVGDQRVRELTLARQIGVSRAAAGVHPGQSLAAAVMLFEEIIDFVAGVLPADAEGLQRLGQVAATLNGALAQRLGRAAIGYTEHLLETIHDAHVGERRRLARELHDRVGQGLAAVQRQLELFDLVRAADPAAADEHVRTAQLAAHEAMTNLRSTTTDLHAHEPVTNIVFALRRFVDSIPNDDVVILLECKGDAAWVPQPVHDEAFLIVREALRNALAHSDPGTIDVNVEIVPHELRASVVDDGGGFAVDDTVPGFGLTSMRERAELLGGTTVLTASPGQPTRVDLTVPLPGVVP